MSAQNFDEIHQVYNNVLNEMASSRKLSSDNKETKRLLKRSMSKSSENIDINTIVPRDISEQRVVLLSSRSHNSDWELNKIDDQHDLNGVESEDSGFQLDIAEPSATTAPVTTVTTTNKNDRSNSLKQDSHQKVDILTLILYFSLFFLHLSYSIPPIHID